MKLTGKLKENVEKAETKEHSVRATIRCVFSVNAGYAFPKNEKK